MSELTAEQLLLKETLEELGAVINGQIFFYKEEGTFGPAYVNKEEFVKLGSLRFNNILRDVAQNALNYEGFSVEQESKNILVIGPAYGATSYPGVIAEFLQILHDSFCSNSPLFLHTRTELDRENDKLHVIPDKLIQLYQMADEFIIIEDIVNGGTTIKQIVELIRTKVSKTAPISAFCLVDRGNNTAENLGIIAFHPLLRVDMPVKSIYNPEDVEYLNSCGLEINTVLGKGKGFVEKYGTGPYTVEQLTQSA